jgi:acyl carrier protein
LSVDEIIRQFLTDNLISFEEDFKIGDNENIFESGFVDSTLAMQLVNFIEEEFKVVITDDELDLINFSTINRIVQFLERKKIVK